MESTQLECFGHRLLATAGFQYLVSTLKRFICHVTNELVPHLCITNHCAEALCWSSTLLLGFALALTCPLQFVDRGGLKPLFGLFMGKTKVKGLLGEHAKCVLLFCIACHAAYHRMRCVMASGHVSCV